MKKLAFLFLIISSVAFAQDLKIVRATMQTINHGASATSSTTYKITIDKFKRSKWKIDSLISILGGDTVKYNVVKVDDPGAASPKYKKVNYFSKSDLGIFQISYGVRKSRETNEKSGAPQNTKVDTTNIEGGVYLYITTKNKHRRYRIDEFEKLETIDAP